MLTCRLFEVAFIGALSNISTLTQTYTWLNWLNWLNGTSTAKALLRGVISGILPPVLLSVLMQLLPMVLRRASSTSHRDACANRLDRNGGLRRHPEQELRGARPHDAILHLPGHSERPAMRLWWIIFVDSP